MNVYYGLHCIVQTLLGYIIIIIGVKNKCLLNGGGGGNRLNNTNQYIE